MGPALPPLSRCRVHVREAQPRSSIAENQQFWASYAPRISRWANDPFSTELHIQRMLSRGHPWLVPRPEEADVIFIAANLSQLCVARKPFTARAIWDGILKDPRLWGGHELPSAARAGPTSEPTCIDKLGLERCIVARRKRKCWRKLFQTGCRATCGDNCSSTQVSRAVAVSLQYWQQCGNLGRFPHGTLKLTDQIQKLERYRTGNDCADCADNLVSPFVISHPAWLVSGRLRSPLPWDERPLLFFGGLVSKLYFAPLRYRLWKQLRNEPRATTQSHTINCSVGAYQVCSKLRESPDAIRFRSTEGAHRWRLPHNLSEKELHLHCAAACYSSRKVEHAHSATQSAQQDRGRTAPFHDAAGRSKGLVPSCLGSWRLSPAQAVAKLKQRCAAYEQVDFGAELADIERDQARSGGRSQYLGAAARHRFCLIAQGDPGNTAKTTETLAIGAAGGCIPVFVLYSVSSDRAPEPTDFLRDYPHMRWLDYCRVAYFVTRHAAQQNMSRVLDLLQRVSGEEAAAKRRAMEAVRPAFVFRDDSSVERPSAAEFMLSEACRWAKARRAGPQADPEPPTAGGAHAQCTITAATMAIERGGPSW